MLIILNGRSTRYEGREEVGSLSLPLGFPLTLSRTTTVIVYEEGYSPYMKEPFLLSSRIFSLSFSLLGIVLLTLSNFFAFLTS